MNPRTEKAITRLTTAAHRHLSYAAQAYELGLPSLVAEKHDAIATLCLATVARLEVRS